MVYENLLITDEDVVVDDQIFRNCRFVSCRVIYNGGGVPEFTNCGIENCQ
jgi:hypothetical protein